MQLKVNKKKRGGGESMELHRQAEAFKAEGVARKRSGMKGGYKCIYSFIMRRGVIVAHNNRMEG